MWNHAMEKLPEHGQKVWYYGPLIGVWSGHYEFQPDDPVSPHLFFCGSQPGVVDRMDAPYWMPISDEKPEPPFVENL